MNDRCLGKLPPKRDPRTLAIASYLRPERFPAPPPLRDWADHAHTFDVLGNDTIGDCAFAAQAHLIQCFAAANGKTCLIGKAAVLGAYSRVTGFDPQKPGTDRGTILIDALNDWRKIGLDGNRIGAYVRLEIANRLHMEAAINLCGGVYLGVALPLAAKTQTIWDVAPPGRYDPTYNANSWGGHAVGVVAYSRTGLVCVTWGKLKVMTWEWLATYTDEAFAVLDERWISEGSAAPNGFDFEAIRRDLDAISATPPG